MSKCKRTVICPANLNGSSHLGGQIFGVAILNTMIVNLDVHDPVTWFQEEINIITIFGVI